MGQTARNTPRSDRQIKLRLTEELETRVDRAWKEGPMSELDRSQFILYLVKLGIGEHDRVWANAEREMEGIDGFSKGRSAAGGT